MPSPNSFLGFLACQGYTRWLGFRDRIYQMREMPSSGLTVDSLVTLGRKVAAEQSGN